MPERRGAILVTGAAGFIGRVVVSKLVARGRMVIGTDVVAPAEMNASTFAVADARDVLRHAALLASAPVDGIVHTGGISGPMLAGDNPAELFDINVRSTVQLLELARTFGLRRFVGCSSVSAYGDLGAAEAVSEAMPLRASTVYGSSKAMADLAIQTYASRFGLSATALRIGWVYGPGRRTDAILQPMIRSGFGGQPFRLARGADQPLQFVHVDDVADALLAALDAAGPLRPAYNINGAEVMSVTGIADLVRAAVPEARIEIGGGMLDDTDQQGTMLLDAAAADLGWTPHHRLEAGIAAYVEWLRTHPY